jgi:acyl carrier protein
VRRHEILRTVFPEVDGEPVQMVRPPGAFDLEIRCLEHLPPSKRREAAQQIAVEETQAGFDLAEGPLFRAVLLRLGEEEHVLLLLMHHIVFDEWSEGILLRELKALYEAFCGKTKTSPLPELTIQYGDFSIWQRKYSTDVVLETQLNYWKRRLQGLSPLLLPTDSPRNNRPSHQGTSRSFTLPMTLVGKFKELSRREHATLFMTALTAFQVLLGRYTGREDITVGVPVAGRTQIETESLIGYFVNLLVLRVALPGSITLQQALHRVRDSALDAYAHQDVPFQRLVKELHPERSATFSPLFQVMFELRNLPKVPSPPSGKLRMETVPFNPDFIGDLDLAVEILENPTGLSCTYRYAPALFRPGTITRMTEDFRVVLQCMVDNPEWRLSELPLNFEGGNNQRTANWNVTENGVFEESCALRSFEAQVKPMAQAEPDVIYDRQSFAAPSKTELERDMVRIWRTVLGLNTVELSDNFFEVGGHSLLMMEVSIKISELLGKKIAVMDLCRYPTIAALVDYLMREQHE